MTAWPIGAMKEAAASLVWRKSVSAAKSKSLDNAQMIGDTASRLAKETDAIRNEGRWLAEQAKRVCETMESAHPVMREARERIRGLESALQELYAVVRGECPRLLNEDSGGSAGLDMKIRSLLNL